MLRVTELVVGADQLLKHRWSDVAHDTVPAPSPDTSTPQSIPPWTSAAELDPSDRPGGKEVLEEFAVPAGTSPTWSWPGRATLCVRGSVLPRAHTEASDLTLQYSPDTRDRDLPACHRSRHMRAPGVTALAERVLASLGGWGRRCRLKRKRRTMVVEPLGSVDKWSPGRHICVCSRGD